MRYLKLFETFNQNEKIANNIFIEYFVFSNLVNYCYIKKIANERYHIFYNSILIFNVFEKEETPLGIGRAWLVGNLNIFPFRLFGPENIIIDMLYDIFGDNPIWKAISKYIRYYEEKINPSEVNEELNWKQIVAGAAIGAASLIGGSKVKSQPFQNIKDKIENTKGKIKDIKNTIKSDNTAKYGADNSIDDDDNLLINVNGSNYKITKKITFQNDKKITQRELQDFVDEVSPLSGLNSQSLIKFLTAEKGPEGSSLHGKDYKIIISKSISNNENAAKMQSIEKSKSVSSDPPYLVTKTGSIKKDGNYISFSFTKVAL